MYLSVFLLEAPVLLDGVEETAALDKRLPGRLRAACPGWAAAGRHGWRPIYWKR